VTNIDNDHMGTWDQDESRLHAAFVEFLRHLPFYGLAVLCTDDPGVRAVLPQVSRPVVTYGFHEEADLRAVDVTPVETRTRFRILSGRHGPEATVTLNLPGRHNVLNALAAVAVARSLEVDDELIGDALATFQGIGRRFEVRERVRIGAHEVRLVDDYGHHPREIEATIGAAREAWPGQRLVVAFQPHRYTRTRDLLDEFARTLSLADALLVTAVYPAGEEAIPGADAHSLCQAVRARGVVEPVYVPGVGELGDTLQAVVRPDDVLVLLGAGDIGTAAATLAEAGGQCGAG
jgi:UDP-N-acetylmuramate--alanine ligase